MPGLRRNPAADVGRHPDTQQQSQAYEKKDSSTIEFLVDLKPQEKKTVTYRVKRLNLEPRQR